MSQARAAIQHLRDTGDLEEAVDLALGREEAPYVVETGGGPSSQRSETWFAANQDDLNQAILFIKDKLPEAKITWTEHTNGSQNGYAVTVAGDFGDHDIASIGAGRQVLYPLSNPPANLGR